MRFFFAGCCCLCSTVLCSTSLGAVPRSDPTPYVSARLGSQLGNQLWLIATALAIAWDHGAQPVFPDLLRKDYNFPLNREKIFFRLSTFQPPLMRWKRCGMEGLKNGRVLYEPYTYQPNMQIVDWGWVIHYFDRYKSRLIQTFAPSREENQAIEAKYGELLRAKDLVGVHIRAYRPDMFAFIGFDYIKEALDRFSDDCTFAIFSCRIDWARHHLRGYKPKMVFIEGNDHVRDFFLLNKCKHHIIGNSTYGFWAAYLKDDPEQRVIVPDFYNYGTESFTVEKGCYPPNWEVLHVENPVQQPDIASYPTTSIHGG
ncbi:MAG: alpha-1,2-fucosyltransferase [Chlamydiia bacterium]